MPPPSAHARRSQLPAPLAAGVLGPGDVSPATSADGQGSTRRDAQDLAGRGRRRHVASGRDAGPAGTTCRLGSGAIARRGEYPIPARPDDPARTSTPFSSGRQWDARDCGFSPLNRRRATAPTLKPTTLPPCTNLSDAVLIANVTLFVR